MKRTFLKVLPFAAAVLLATSCSKDDNNSVDEIVNNGGEQTETVVKTFKTLTVKGKVNKTISKVTTNQEGTALAFEGNEVFTFGNSSDNVYGTINFTDANGSYTATINYTDEKYLGDGFTATLGSNPTLMSEPYSDLATAVQNAYYEIPFNVTSNGEGSYLLSHRGFLSKDAPSAQTDIVVYLQSAFIKALSAESTTLGGAPITVEADKYYVVPEGKTMGETSTTTLAGQIYSLGTKAPENCIAGVFSVSATKQVYFSKGNLQATTTDLGENWSWGFAANQWDYVGEATANTTINGNGTVSTNGTVDLFGWVGASSNFEGAAQYGISNSKTTDNVNGYGTGDNESLKSDWGKVFGSDSPWRTLTGGNSGEWKYLLNTRATTSGVRYAVAQVNGVNGLIIVPDDWNADTYTLQSTNTPYVGFTTNTINEDTWTNTLEKAGAVFLPASGRRYGSGVIDAGSYGRYWSSSALNMFSAYLVGFSSGDLNPADNFDRYGGFSVRLVRAAE